MDTDRDQAMLALEGELQARADEIARLTAENERLRTVELEALRVLGAVVYYGCGGLFSLSDGALNDDYAVERTTDVATASVRFRAWPTERHERAERAGAG